jgi:CheY-like chemotaxis protein/anti-sigma regulatory factor (Ser/Thr protein kinase)
MTHTVLAIDDEAPNLLLIEAYLDGAGHDVRYFPSGAAAMAYLRAGGPAEAILLDRMMPDGDGLEFMKEFKSLPKFGMVPVIMQTAAAFPAQIAEGIAAGAYYYLTKPYSRELLTTVLSRALADHAFHQQREEAVARLRAVAGRIGTVELSFRSLKDVRDIAAFLASLYPRPADVVLGIRELMLNAVEHGNLGISYAEKSALVRAAGWQQEIERRLALPSSQAKAGRIRLERDAGRIVLTIEDSGPGFDWARYLEFDKSRARDPHGRGIAMARMVSFDEIAYVAPGNKVICTNRVRHEESERETPSSL